MKYCTHEGELDLYEMPVGGKWVGAVLPQDTDQSVDDDENAPFGKNEPYVTENCLYTRVVTLATSAHLLPPGSGPAT